ncbi:secretogranin-3 [Brachyhypopomus gauderio]|uniref:secretogranin-3 n=1 Tax=Brachyhypopomus gauderio TaxID=698409 RepID=UPI00404259E3
MASKRMALLLLIQISALICFLEAFPTPAGINDKTEYNRQLTEERPLQQQIAEADSLSKKEPKPTQLTNSESSPNSDDVTLLRFLAQKSKKSNNKTPRSDLNDEHSISDEADSTQNRRLADSTQNRRLADSTQNRRLADDYDSTKNGMDNKYQDDPESLHQLDGTPLTAEDIVQKIANKIYQEDDRGVFDRIVSKLLKLGLITESQADTLEHEVAAALQDLITKHAQDNEIEELGVSFPAVRAEDTEDTAEDTDEKERPSHQFDEDNDARDDGNAEEEGDAEEREEDSRDNNEGAVVDETWDGVSEGNDRNELSPDDGLQDLQYFPNFYRLLKSLDSEQDSEERDTLITIMKTLIDFVKMMVKYGTITPEEGVSYLENVDSMIAMQTKNKLGKTLGALRVTPPTAKVMDKDDITMDKDDITRDEDDITKDEAAKMQQEYESLKDSTKGNAAATENSHIGQSENYLVAIKKNIEWLKQQKKSGNRDDYDLSKLRDFMGQQVDAYIKKGILEKDEGDAIKRIYGSL